MYTDVITLAEAKNYLRIDDTLTEDDAQITRMINASLAYIENWTNHIMYDRPKEYILVDGKVSIYDHPINSLLDPVTEDVKVELRTLYSNFYNTTQFAIVLDVGYADPSLVPPELKEVAFEIIDLMYYEHDSGKKYTKDLTTMSVDILNRFRRFLI